MDAQPDPNWPETDDLLFVLGKLHLTVALPPDLPTWQTRPEPAVLHFTWGKLNVRLDFPADP